MPLTLTPRAARAQTLFTLQMPISNLVECAVNLAENVTGNLVECAVNLAENVTGVDIDRDGDIGVRAVPFHDCNAVPLASHTPTMHTQTRLLPQAPHCS